MKIASIVGTRPELIKMSAFFKEMENDVSIDHFIIHTGQHYDKEMDQDIIKDLSIKGIRYQGKISGPGFSSQIAAFSSQIEEALDKEEPEFVIVQGDTNSAMMGAMCAARKGIKVLHVEAGCRSGNQQSPEEQNRKIIDSISYKYFCVDNESRSNLLREGISEDNLFLVGSTLADSASYAASLVNSVDSKYTEEKYGLVTLHRAEGQNSKQDFQNKIEFINRMSKNLPMVFPVHPRTNKFINENGIKLSENIELLPPVSYVPFVKLIKESKIILTDSGGIQEEAAIFNRPCFVLRPETEWNRLVEIKKNFLLPILGEEEETLVNSYINDKELYLKNRAIKAEGLSTGASKKIKDIISNLS